MKYSFIPQNTWLFWDNHTSETIWRDHWKSHCDGKGSRNKV